MRETITTAAAAAIEALTAAIAALTVRTELLEAEVTA
jgi:hypothetical protein